MESDNTFTRRVCAVLLADVTGFSTLMGENDERTAHAVHHLQSIAQGIVSDNNGRAEPVAGDALFATFDSVVAAVQAAVAIQRRIADEAVEGEPLQIRIGVHLGDVLLRDGRAFGDAINIAARLEALARPGTICVSEGVYRQVRNKFDEQFVDLGRQQLKNISDPVHAYLIVPKGVARGPAPRRAAMRWAVVAATLIVVAVGGGVAVWRYRQPAAPSVAGNEDRKSIAVLPFVNMSSDKENEYFSDGITEDLITALSKVSGLHVAARTSSFAFKGKNEPIESIGAQLHVGAVLEGSVAKAGNQVRITAQLINVENGYHLWSDSYDRDLQDIFAIRSQVAQTVAKALQVTLVANERHTLDQKPTEDLEAYQLYLKGRHAAATFADPVTAMRYLQQAIARDPNYALAYDGLAYYYWAATDGILSGSECLPRAREAAEKALQLDPSLAEAHTWLGSVHWWYDRDYAAARREFEAAVTMQPDLASAHEVYGWFLVAAGQVDEGLAESRRAVELDPLSSETNAALGINLYLTRHYDEAIKQLRSAINTDPDYGYAHGFLGRAYARTGRFSEAIAELHTAMQPVSGPEAEAALGRTYADAGDRGKATDVLNHLREQMREQFVSAAFLATVHIGLGEVDEAFAALEEAAAQHSYYAGWWKLDPELDPLRSDPRFTALLEKVGFDK
jgi:adenylate cyclase